MDPSMHDGCGSQIKRARGCLHFLKRGCLRWCFIGFIVCVFIRVIYIRPISPQHDFRWSFNATRDIAVYVHPNNVTAIIENAGFCQTSGEKIFLLIVICSASGNFEARSAIRESWASFQNIRTLQSSNSSHYVWKVKVAFLLGDSYNSTVQEEILKESDSYGDIIQEGFHDSYLNLTLKSVMMLKWASTYCPKAKFLFKTDDDMFVNVPELLKYLKQPAVVKRDNLISGSLFCWAKPIKDHHSKWYSPDFMFQGREYPNYVSGTGYVVSGALVPRLFNASLQVPFFHLEDIFVTGIVARKLDIVPENYHLFSYYKHNVSQPCLYRHIVTSHGLKPQEILTVWTDLRDPGANCTSYKVPTIGEPKLKTCIKPKQKPAQKYG